MNVSCCISVHMPVFAICGLVGRFSCGCRRGVGSGVETFPCTIKATHLSSETTVDISPVGDVFLPCWEYDFRMLSCCTTRVRESLQLSLACAAFGHQIAPIIPHISFQLRSGYMNSAPLMCAPSTGNSMGTSDWCMSFDVCESKSCTHSVPRPRFGMAGGVDLLMLYFISVCLSCSLM